MTSVYALRWRECCTRVGVPAVDLERREGWRFSWGMKASSPWMASSVSPGLAFGARARTGVCGRSTLRLLLGGKRGDWSPAVL